MDKELILDDIFKQLHQIIDEAYIELWLHEPNVTFNNKKPIDLINDNHYQPLYDMIRRLENGEPL